MDKHRKYNRHHQQQQKGAVAIIVALCLTLLVGMLGLVLDLGHLYVGKTELQNAADSASLSGAKELNGQVAGINNAITRAIEAAGKNNFDLDSNPVVITASNIWVGSCPSDGCMVPISSVTTNALASDKTFVKVDTGLRSLNTWFIQVLPGVANTTQTLGLAVAGKYAVDITPIAICALDESAFELGFERGLSYKVSEVNPLGAGTMFWIDPESNVPGACSVTNTNATLPYVCSGKTGFTPIIGETVNTNTGVSIPQVAALNSRFGDYTPQNRCDPTTAPSDSNVKEYLYNNSGAGSPIDWMNPNPNRQSLRFLNSSGGDCRNNDRNCHPVAAADRSESDYGVLWSAFRKSDAVVNDWSTLYGGNTATSYPEPSPYAQTSGNFFTAPPVAYRPGVPGRRVMNMVIVRCLAGPGVCRPATVTGVGRFFMQRRTQLNQGGEVFVEFGGLLPTPLPTSDIKLYR